MSAASETTQIAGPEAIHDREAEEAVIASCLINPGVFPGLEVFLHAADFYVHRLGWAWQAMSRLASRGESIDIITVANELGDRLHEFGGAAFLTELVNLRGSSLHAESYGHIVKRDSQRRQVIRAANRIAELASRQDLEAPDLVSAVTLELERATSQEGTGAGRPLGEEAAAIFQQAQAMAQGKVHPGVPSGITGLDEILGGGWQTGLIVVTGYPGVGKTAFVTMIARTAGAIREVRFHCLEMSAAEMALRFLAQETGLSSQAIAPGHLEPHEWEKLAAAVETCGALRITIDDSAPMTMPQLKAISLAERPDLLIVDSAGLIEAPGEREYDQHRYVSNRLKNLSRMLGVPVIVTHQLNRRGHEEATLMPHHLRGSGTWEQDADVILILEPGEDGAPKGCIPIRLKVAKQRNGPKGMLNLVFHPRSTRFEQA